MKQESDKSVEVSVVIPARDERETVDPLYRGIVSSLENLGKSFEIIFVDDGSEDGTFDVLREIAERDSRVRAIKFLKNFGKSAALAAGFSRSRGKIIITMDADLQDDPAELPRFLEELEKGYHLVTGWKKERKDPFGKRLSSRLFNLAAGLLSGLRLHDMNCGFKALRREAAESVRIYGELHRFLPVLAAARGFKVNEIPVKHHPRRYGKSKYGLGRAPRAFFDLLTVLFLTQYERRPLHLFGGAGAVMGFLGFAALAYLTVLWFMKIRPIGTRPLFMGGIMLLLLGAQLVSLGLMGELITHHFSTPADNYVIEEELGG